MESIYKILNKQAKNWWWHLDLRKAGNEKEARELERKHIKSNIETIRKVQKHGGYLNLGRSQWSVNIFEYSTGEGSTRSESLSGYYNGFGDEKICYFESIFKRLNLPVLDSREMSFEDGFEYIKGPIINRKTGNGYVSLSDFKKMKSHIENVKFYNID